MIKTVILTPSRARPHRFWEMRDSAQFTSGAGQVGVAVGLDDDEPELDTYLKIPHIKYVTGTRKNLVEWTNELAKRVINSKEPPRFLVSAGDDHYFSSFGWDERLIDGIQNLNGPGFAYGDDLTNGSGLCTSWMASIEVVKSLGWMALPGCEHMYIDNAILELGQETGRISYVPEAIIEHRHYLNYPALLDETYLGSNSDEQHERDLRSYRQWRYGPQFYRDCKAVLELKY
jgi:hypothetical protein